MADKTVTVEVPEDRVPEFYLWFAAFLASEPGAAPPAPGFGPGFGPPRGRGRHGRGHMGGPWGHQERRAWSEDSTEEARWLYGRLSEPARELFDLLMEESGEPFAGEEIARRLGLEKGAHGVAGVLAWPGRYSRHLGRLLPIETTGRPDGGTDYYMEPEVGALFRTARGE